MVTAIRLISGGLADRVGIVDYDFHFDDGTDDIIRRLHLKESLVQVNGDMSDAAIFFDSIDDDLRDLGKIDIVLYQAGADMHINDPLGGMLMTDEMRGTRTEIVFRWCKQWAIPIAWNLAGGYQHEPDGSIPKVHEIHRNTMLASMEVFAGHRS